MQRHASWYLLAGVATAGWGIVAFIAWWIIAHMAWFGVMLIGVIVLYAATRPELTEDAPAASDYLLQRQYAARFEGGPESRTARFAAAIERHRWLYLVRTVGIALAVLGVNMFILHQIGG